MITKRRRQMLKRGRDKSPEEAEKMLIEAGWRYDGPKKTKSIAPYWTHPRSKRLYTKEAAINIEELHESLD